MVIVDVFYLYFFSRGGGGGVILSACVVFVAGFLPAATVGFVPTVFCQLGCLLGVQSVMSIGVLCVPYMCLFVEFRVIIIIYMLIFLFLGYVKVIFICC